MAKNPKGVDLPDSRIFAASDAVKEAERERMLNAHWQGTRIREYPEQQRDTILRHATWAETDEGRAEAIADAKARGVYSENPIYVSPRNPADKPRGYVPDYGSNPITRYGAERQQGRNPVDPLTAVRENWERANPGMCGHWSNSTELNLEHINIPGMTGKQIVYDESGKPIRFRELVLTCEPRDAVEERRASEVEMANRQLLQMHDKHVESVKKEIGTDRLPADVIAANTGLQRLQPNLA